MPEPFRARRRRHPATAALFGVLVLGACGSETVEPTDTTPTITVSGVSDGATVTGTVTITIAVDVGSFTATLNGDPFVSGRTVTQPDDYLLEVSATNGTATASTSVSFTIAFAGSSRLIIRMFDLGDNDAGGGGDAILVTDSSAAGQRHALVDAGPAGMGGTDPDFVRRRLAALGVDTLEVLILSHAHSDHYGGMALVAQNVVVKEFVYNGQVRSLASYTSLMSQLQASALATTVPDSIHPVTLTTGGVATVLSVLPPLATYLANTAADSREINEGSLGALLVRGPFTMFFTGDGEVEANFRWRTQFPTLTTDVTVLKVGHHGANDATFDNGSTGISTWLAQTNPVVAVASANGTSHPRVAATVALNGRASTEFSCTNVHGDIEIRVDEAGLYTVTRGANAADICEAGTDATTE